MTSQQAIDLIKWINTSKSNPHDVAKMYLIKDRAERGIRPDEEDRKFLNELYRIGAGGGDKQDQPFKQYKRKKSWGV